MEARGGKALVLPTDVSDADAVEAAAHAVAAEAIVWAAEHERPEMYVGGPAVAVAAGAALLGRDSSD